VPLLFGACDTWHVLPTPAHFFTPRPTELLLIGSRVGACALDGGLLLRGVRIDCDQAQLGYSRRELIVSEYPEAVGAESLLKGMELQDRRTSLCRLAISQEIVASPSKPDSG
jgi:hypothetical protein